MEIVRKQRVMRVTEGKSKREKDKKIEGLNQSVKADKE